MISATIRLTLPSTRALRVGTKPSQADMANGPGDVEASSPPPSWLLCDVVATSMYDSAKPLRACVSPIICEWRSHICVHALDSFKNWIPPLLCTPTCIFPTPNKLLSRFLVCSLFSSHSWQVISLILRYALSIPGLSRTFILKGYWILLMALLHLMKWSWSLSLLTCFCGRLQCLPLWEEVNLMIFLMCFWICFAGIFA